MKSGFTNSSSFYEAHKAPVLCIDISTKTPQNA